MDSTSGNVWSYDFKFGPHILNITVTSQRKISSYLHGNADSKVLLGPSRTALTALLSQDNGVKASTGA